MLNQLDNCVNGHRRTSRKIVAGKLYFNIFNKNSLFCITALGTCVTYFEKGLNSQNLLETVISEK